ncbi:MAG TPA: quinone-dependent dihydroorotate dehydrogenase [Pyrinomonadaceae bacterium]|nr:quinone-dependent dihydroorotate dehydrogenase [Pyrinomonadaceae bacterium]
MFKSDVLASALRPRTFVTRNLPVYSLIRPLLFRLPAETAHGFALSTLSAALEIGTIRRVVTRKYQSTPFSNLKRFGLTFRNPVGLAAGFDKNGDSANLLATLGFGFIEVGTVTSEPQAGNPSPRLFRLPRDHALINRLGFNNCGAQQLVKNLKRHRPNCVLGVNIGKARSVSVERAIPDYLKTFAAVYEVADYIAVNVSSPNTPQLRELQQSDVLRDLLAQLQTRNHELADKYSLTAPRPLLVKIAPDLNDEQIASIVEVAQRTRISGIIATNTTTGRQNLHSSPARVASAGEGGLSGAPLRERSNQVIRTIYRLTRGSLPIVGVGGVFTAEDAWEKICAGASLIQLYTGFIYEGPGVARRINEGLRRILSSEGFVSLDEAVGCRADLQNREP